LAYDPRHKRTQDLRDGEGLERWVSKTRERVRLLDRFEWSCQRSSDGSTLLTAPNGEVIHIRHGADGIVLRECSNRTREWLQYDHEGRLEGRMTSRQRPGGGAIGWGARYGYSPEGDLLSVSDSVRGTTQYQVDEAHRLIGETTPSGEQLQWTFDAANNLVDGSARSRLSLHPGNRADATSTEVFEHDRRDRLTVRRHRDGPVTRYQYDSFDMLEEIERIDGERTTSWRAAYDAIGRRLWTEVCRPGLDGRRREFYWDGDRLAAELDPAGRLRIYLYAGHDALAPLAFVDYDDRSAAPARGRLYHVFCDGAGMPLHVEDERGEIVWWASRVDPWGKLAVHESAQVEYNLRWPGHYFDQETGLHYNRYRYYDPELGRYLTPDPIGYRGSDVNLYAYCTNPLVQVDVLGLAHSGKGDGPDTRSTSADVDGSDPPPRAPADGPEAPPGGYPPRTAEAQRQCQRAVDTLNQITGPGRGSVVSVFTHADGTVSVGISGADTPANRQLADNLQGRLNDQHRREVRAQARANGEEVPKMDAIPDRYRVANETMPTDNIREVPGGNAPGECGEPHSAHAAHGHDSPIDGMDTRWRGKGENPHPFSGENADGAPVQPNQMDPCNTCGDPNNIDEYMNHANS
jgi:RHS repeat-associated protein